MADVLEWVTWRMVVMYAVGLVLIFLAIRKKYEPALLLPMGFGAILVNLPQAGLVGACCGQGVLHWLFDVGIDSQEVMPILLFIGIGAMMDFTPLLRKPGLFLCGLFSQGGIFLAAMIACLAGFSRAESLAIGIIGAADGPTAIFVAKHLNSSFSGQIALASYSYIALVPLILPVVARFLVTRKERLIRADSDWGQKELPRIVRIAFPIAVTLLSGFIAPRSAELVGFLMFGNLVRECGVLDTMAETARTTLCNLITLLLGISISFTMQAESFVQPETLLILAIGLAAFILDNICGVLFVKVWNLFRKNRINPLAGLAGISAFPIAAHVTQNIAHDADSSNIILMDTAAANVSGQLCSAIIGGIFMGFVC